MDCTPLYGVGKAEFTISSGDVDFPADFQTLDSTAVRSAATSTTSGAAVDVYTSRPTSAPAGMMDLQAPTTTATTQTYSSTVIVPIDRASLLRLDPVSPVGGCVGSVYNTAYSYATLATTTTFTQVAGGETWTYDITTPASTSYLYLNLENAGGTAAFDSTAPQCATDGTVAGTISVATPPFGFTLVTGVKATNTFGSTLSPFFGSSGQLGTVSRVAAAPAPAAVEPAPGLAATGTDVALPALLAAALLAAGASVTLLARRRRTVV